MLKKTDLDIMSILQENDAIIDGHFELPNGKHVQSYIDTDIVIQYPSLSTKIATALAGLFDKKIDVVFSPSSENAILAGEVARIKNARAICATQENGRMALKDSLIIRPNETVLIVDNVMMTGRKIMQAMQLLTPLHVHILGVAVIVDRSNGVTLENTPLRALLTYPLDIYEKEDCPMCKDNFPLIKKGVK